MPVGREINLYHTFSPNRGDGSEVWRHAHDILKTVVQSDRTQFRRSKRHSRLDARLDRVPADPGLAYEDYRKVFVVAVFRDQLRVLEHD